MSNTEHPGAEPARKPGFQPYIPAMVKMAELTVRVVVMGAVLDGILGVGFVVGPRRGQQQPRT